MALYLADTNFAEATWLQIVKALLIFAFLLGVTPMVLLLERKLMGRMQSRYGPNRVGPWGLAQPLADVIKLLLKAVDKLPLESLRVQRSPVAVMTAWLESDEAPYNFTIDQDTELRATGESKAAVRYVKHSLDPEDIRRHIAAGKQCTRLAMTWNSRVSFVLTESLAIKGVKPLDVIKENETITYSDDERFDNDIMLMTGELSKMMADLVDALGGEAKA